MTMPSGTMIRDWILGRVHTSTPPRLVVDYVRDALSEIAPGTDELAREIAAVDRTDRMVNMLVEEQARAGSGGITTFEVIGDGQDAIIKGFSIGLTSDSPEIRIRRRHAALAEPVRAALNDLSASEFEALWGILVRHLGAQNFALKGKSGDGGIDFTADFNVYRLIAALPHVAQEWVKATESRSAVTVIGQAKHTPNRKLRPAIMRELVGTMFLHEPDIPRGERKGATGMLVTTGSFASTADAHARRSNIILLDGEWVIAAIINFGLGVIHADEELDFSASEFKQEIRLSVVEQLSSSR